MSICVKSQHRQRGDMLLEALIGVLITALIAGGMAHLTARLQASQWESRIQGLLVESARNQLQTEGLELCGRSLDLPAALMLETVPAFSCDEDTAANLTLSLNSQSIAITPPKAIKISIDTTALDIPGPELVMGTQQ